MRSGIRRREEGGFGGTGLSFQPLESLRQEDHHLSSVWAIKRVQDQSGQFSEALSQNKKLKEG